MHAMGNPFSGIVNRSRGLSGPPALSVPDGG